MRGRRALVTGAAGQIGSAVARRFARDGMRVALTDVDAAGLERTRSSLATGTECLLLPGEVTDERRVVEIVATTHAQLGGLDVVVTAAGIFPPLALCPVTELDYDMWTRIVSVNLHGTFLYCREAARIMSAQRSGRIVTLGSINGKWGSPLSSAYAASKHGVLG